MIKEVVIKEAVIKIVKKIKSHLQIVSNYFTIMIISIERQSVSVMEREL